MKRGISILVVGVLTAGVIASTSFPSFAEDNVEELKKQVESLQKRVDELESSHQQQQQQQSQQQPQQNNGFGYFNGNQNNGGWDPFSEMSRMQDEMNRMFQNSFNNRRGSWPGGGMFSNNLSYDKDFDLKETDSGYEIKFDMSGLNKDKFDVQINKNSITVKGEYSNEETNKGKDRYFSAQSFGSFMKTIPLPVDADTAKVKTEKEGDNLVIRIPKKTS
jgi:HSP20 family protein